MVINLENPLLEFQPNVVEDVRKIYGFKNQEDMDKAVEILDQWVKQQKHFNKKDFAPEYLERLIISSKGSIEKSKTKLDKLCTFRTLLPQYFELRDFKTGFDDINSVLYHGLLPKTTKDHERIFYVKCFGQKFEPTLFLNYFKAGAQVAEYMRAYDYSTAFQVILDYSETNLKEFLSNLNFIDLQNCLNVFINAYGYRVKGIHIVSGSKLIDILVSMFKQIVSKKIADRIHVHQSPETVKNFIPKEVLPKEYGGDDISLAKINDNWLDVLSREDFKNYLKEAYKATTNEDLRPRDRFNDQYMGVSGTFRTLTVD